MIPAEIAAALGAMTGVSRETFGRLEAMQGLLRRWTAKINLVSRASLETSWERHVLDSAQLWPLRPKAARRWVDLGSGAGFPGLVIAMIAQEVATDIQVVLVESDARKAAYLAAVARETGTPARIVNERIEALAPLGADVLSARALAPLPDLLAMAEKHRVREGICLFPKGRTVHKEIEAARIHWEFGAVEHRSLTDPTAVILEIGAMHRV